MQQSAVEMSVFEAILARRSVRHYTSEIIAPATVRLLLEAAVRAPTAFHGEPWSFAVVQEKDALRLLSDRAKPLFLDELRQVGQTHQETALAMFSDPEFNIFYDANALIVLCADTMSPFAAADCWLAAENMMLAACAMGLGSCVIGCALPALNLPAVKSELGIPEKFSAIAPIIVGYSAEETAPTPRREPTLLHRHVMEQPIA